MDLVPLLHTSLYYYGLKSYENLALSAVKHGLCFSQLFPENQQDFFVECDPEGSHIGSGGGTAWILSQFWKTHADGKKILIHAGGRNLHCVSW